MAKMSLGMNTTESAAQVLKRCNQCKELLSFCEFHRDKRKDDGRQNRCKDCLHTYRRNKESLDMALASREIHLIPNIYLVGFGRLQTYQHCCLKCTDGFFNPEIDRKIEDLFCEGCYPDADLLSENNSSETHHVGNVVGWIVKTPAETRRRTSRNYKKAYRRDEYTCQYCGYSLEVASAFRALHIDHIKPWSQAGGNALPNLVVSCELCNCIASNKWFSDFSTKREFIRGALEKRKSPIYD